MSSVDHVSVCRALWEQKMVVDALQARVDEESRKLTSLKMEAIKLLDAQGLTKQHIPGSGTIFVQPKYSIKVPKEREAKNELCRYVVEKHDSLDDLRAYARAFGSEGRGFALSDLVGNTLAGLLTINSATLNAFWSKEFQAAKERGEVRWKLPGVEEPELYKQIGTRKE